ncbi:MAG: ABC transporter substrate-binding protein [Deltaproteobacteria bacterium]|nr:ABC transporter substrate-binding protein [Deltaproteobacteria bacterium]
MPRAFFSFSSAKPPAAYAFLVGFFLSFSATATNPRSPQFLPSSSMPFPKMNSPAESPKSYSKVVSLAPVVTETLFSLGLAKNIVGVTRFCDRPSQAKHKEKIGGYVDVSLEKVLSLRPDLVIAMPSLGQRALLEQIAGQGIDVYVVFGDTLVEVKDLIAGIGAVMNKEKEASFLLAELEKGLKEAKATNAITKKSVLLLVAAAPLVAAGPTTFANDALRVLGLSNAAQKGPQWPVLSLESLAALSPDLIVVVSGPNDGKNVREKVTAAGLKVRILVPSKPILMRPGPSLHLDVQVLGKLLSSQPKIAQ